MRLSNVHVGYMFMLGLVFHTVTMQAVLNSCSVVRLCIIKFILIFVCMFSYSSETYIHFFMYLYVFIILYTIFIIPYRDDAGCAQLVLHCKSTPYIYVYMYTCKYIYINRYYTSVYAQCGRRHRPCWLHAYCRS